MLVKKTRSSIAFKSVRTQHETYFTQFRGKWRIILFTSPLIGLFLSSPVLLLTGEPLHKLPKEILFTSSLGIIVWAIQIVFSKLLEKFRFRRIILWIVSSLVINILLYFLFKIHHQDLAVSFEYISLLRVSNGILLNSIVFILHEWYSAYKFQKVLTDENHRLQLIHLQHKLTHLERQVNPHFLFNTLASLRHLIRKSSGEAENYLHLLSSYLRMTLELKESLIPIKEEIELSRLYMELQKIRFGNAIDFKFSENVSNSSARVPFLTLQSLLENALKHNTMNVTIPLEIRVNFGLNYITVENNIQPKMSKDSSKKGMGLAIMNQRLIAAGGKEISIDICDNTYKATLYLLNECINC